MSRIGDIDAGTYDVDTMVPLSRMEAIMLKIAKEGGGGGESDMKTIIVDELPTTDIKDGVVYMVPGENPTEGNLYDEYVHTPNGWEMISSADFGDVSDETIDNLWNDDQTVDEEEPDFEF